MLWSILSFAIVAFTRLTIAAEVAVYWGQNSVSATYPSDSSKWEKNLAHYCQSGSYKIVIVSFLDGFPTLDLNLANHCWTTFDGTSLLHCPDVAKDIKICQKLGVKIFLSLGGGSGAYGLGSNAEGKSFAKVLWNTFGGGSSNRRPFDDAVVDGFDLDIEGGNAIGYGAMINELSSTYFKNATKKFYISGAPQCPFPDAWLGPKGSTALATAAFDYIFVQFYNNYCGVSTPTTFNFKTWNDWAATSKNPKLKVLIGVPASKDAGGGYVSPSTVVSLANKQAGLSNYGGVMMWDAGSAEANGNFGSAIAKGIGAINPCLASWTETSTTERGAGVGFSLYGFGVSPGLLGFKLGGLEFWIQGWLHCKISLKAIMGGLLLFAFWKQCRRFVRARRSAEAIEFLPASQGPDIDFKA